MTFCVTVGKRGKSNNACNQVGERGKSKNTKGMDHLTFEGGEGDFEKIVCNHTCTKKKLHTKIKTTRVQGAEENHVAGKTKCHAETNPEKKFLEYERVKKIIPLPNYPISPL